MTTKHRFSDKGYRALCQGVQISDADDDSLVHNAMLCLFQFQRFIRMGIGFQLACAAVDGATGLQVIAVGGYL